MAYVGMAETYISMGVESMAPRESMPKAKEYAQKALRLNEGLAEAHSALGIINLVYDWDWPAAAQEFRRNLSLSPQSIETFSCALHYADPMGRNDEAIAGVKQALALDPSSLPSNLELGCAFYYGRHYDQSIKQSRETLAMYPENPGASFLLGRAYAQKKSYSDAISVLSNARPGSGDWPTLVAELGYAYAASGNRAEAQNALQDLRKQAAQRFVDPYLSAEVYIGLGDKEQTLAELEKAYRERSSNLPWLKLEPKWDSLHSDPRFTDLVRRVGL
jgi:tetratricopeptide (TPR) repeat protein